MYKIFSLKKFLPKNNNVHERKIKIKAKNDQKYIYELCHNISTQNNKKLMLYKENDVNTSLPHNIFVQHPKYKYNTYPL